MRNVDFVAEKNKEDWVTLTEVMCRQGVKDAAEIFRRHLQFKGTRPNVEDDKWHLDIRDADTSQWFQISFVRPMNGNQEWYTQEIVRQLKDKLT